jgi:predicted transcriptional regulator
MQELSTTSTMAKPYLLEVLEDYLEIENNIGAIIKNTGYKHEFIAQKLNMPISTYYIRRRTKTFSAKDVFKIVKMLEDEETYNTAELELIESRMNDEVISADEFIEKVQATMML